MNGHLASLTNEKGSALLIVVLLVPVLTLFCIFASNVSYQNMIVITNDRCHRDGLYNADGAVYGTSKLISLIGRSKTREAVEAGEDKAAPGIVYSNTGADKAEEFVQELIEGRVRDTTEDVQFVKPDSAEDVGIESTVDISTLGGANPAGGGAEFGMGADGVGAQINVVVYRLQSKGKSSCPNTAVQVNGDYWMIATKGAETKGI